MQTHWHSGIDNVIVYGVSAIVFINLFRFGAGQLAKRGGGIGQLGKSLGGLVQFG